MAVIARLAGKAYRCRLESSLKFRGGGHLCIGVRNTVAITSSSDDLRL